MAQPSPSKVRLRQSGLAQCSLSGALVLTIRGGVELGYSGEYGEVLG